MNKKLLLGIGGVLGVGAYVVLRKLRANAAPEPNAPFAIHQDALPVVDDDEPVIEAEPVVEPVQPPARSSKKRNRRKAARTTAPRRVRRKAKR